MLIMGGAGGGGCNKFSSAVHTIFLGLTYPTPMSDTTPSRTRKISHHWVRALTKQPSSLSTSLLFEVFRRHNYWLHTPVCT